MRIAIIGYGSMGREVEKAALTRGHQISSRVDPGGHGDSTELSAEILSECDGVIEFALADGVMNNAQIYAQCEIPAVIGTTGWYDELEKMKLLFQNANSPCLYGTNFSPGAHIFFALAEKTAKILDNLPEYDMMLHEYHHKNKKDSPSGTALTTADRILTASKRKKRIVSDSLDRRIEADELHVSSTRGGAIPGIHRLTIDSEADSINIEHSARNRGGFALGSVLALEWLQNKKGLFSVDQFMQDFLGGIA